MIDFSLLRERMKVALGDYYFVISPNFDRVYYREWCDPHWIERGVTYGFVRPGLSTTTSFSSRKVQR